MKPTIFDRIQAAFVAFRTGNVQKWNFGPNYGHVTHIRDGRIIGKYRATNDIVVVGKNHALDVVFGNSTPVAQVDPWYIGLINNTPTPSLSENDTLASHAGWTEFTSYTGTRKAWDDANAAAKAKGTTTTSDFTISADADIYGLFVCSVTSGTSGVLWATMPFDNGIASVKNLDVFKVTYGIQC